MRTGVIVQARMGSSRLPGKVLRDLCGRPVLGHLLARLEHAAVDTVVVATSDRAEDDPVAAFAARAGVAVHRGPLDDVLGRFVAAARAHRLQRVVRVCGDSPLLDPALVDRALRLLAEEGTDIASNVAGTRTFPAGQSVEALRRDVLERLDILAAAPADREHVTRFAYGHPDLFSVAAFHRDPPADGHRLVVDTPADLAYVVSLVQRMTRPAWSYGLDELLDVTGHEGRSRAA
jgi:spore coat polysaccharide biosynthesis protein SpsF